MDPSLLVSKEALDGFTVIYCRNDDVAPASLTIGPVRPVDAPVPEGTVWVMNDHGATVATYHL